MNGVEFEGKTIDDAIEKACQEFKVPREKLNIEILSNGSPGILGLVGTKKARIRAGILRLDLEIEKPPVEEKAEGPAPVHAQAEPAQPERRPDVDPGLAVRARDVLQGMLRHMGLEFPIKVEETDEAVYMNISGDGSGLLIGKNGQTLDAIQHIVNKAANKSRKDNRIIILDTEEYRGRREEHLVALAMRLAEKVKKNKKPISVNYLNARDRRIIHMTLKNDPALHTKSRGEGPYRKIVILPKRKERD